MREIIIKVVNGEDQWEKSAEDALKNNRKIWNAVNMSMGLNMDAEHSKNITKSLNLKTIVLILVTTDGNWESLSNKKMKKKEVS